MKKSFGSITGLLFFVGLLFVASSMNSTLPVNITADTLRNLTGVYWNYTEYDQTWVIIRNVAVQGPEDRSHFAVLNITYEAFGNETYSYYKAYESFNVATVKLSLGLAYGQYVADVNTYSRVKGVEEFLRVYSIYVVIPQVAANVTHPQSAANLTVELPSRYFYDYSNSNLDVYIYNATFIGNSPRDSIPFRGKIYAKFNVSVFNQSSWYSQSFYDQDIVYDLTGPGALYYNESLLNGSKTLYYLLAYYVNNISDIIISEAANNKSTPTSPTYRQNLPTKTITGYNPCYWAKVSTYECAKYYAFNYQVKVNIATFEGTNDNTTGLNGAIYLRFDAYGNDSYTPSYNRSQTWETDVNATIRLSNSKVSYIDYGRSLRINESEISDFLRGWVVNEVLIYDLINSNASNATASIMFSEMNITSYYLNNVSPGWYQNYTAANYYVYVFGISSSLEIYNNDVIGLINFTVMAFGNDTWCTPNYYTSCNPVIAYSRAAIYVNGVQSNSTPDFYQDYSTRVNASDVQNFLRVYYRDVIVPNITYYYNLTNNTTNSTTNQTIYLPNYYNDTQINIDCSQVAWYYCSNANPQSSLFFLGAVANNMSITVDGNGYGYFNGNMKIPYMANLINFTSTYEGKETIIDNLQGNATLYLSGQVGSRSGGSYYIQLDSYPSASANFDRNYFVQNAVQTLFYDRYGYSLSYYVNGFLSR